MHAKIYIANRSWKNKKRGKKRSFEFLENTCSRLTAKASGNARLECLESITISTASSVNERSTGLLFLVEVESLGRTGSARPDVDRFFANRWIIIVQNSLFLSRVDSNFSNV